MINLTLSCGLLHLTLFFTIFYKILSSVLYAAENWFWKKIWWVYPLGFGFSGVFSAVDYAGMGSISFAWLMPFSVYAFICAKFCSWVPALVEFRICCGSSLVLSCKYLSKILSNLPFEYPLFTKSYLSFYIEFLKITAFEEILYARCIKFLIVPSLYRSGHSLRLLR